MAKDARALREEAAEATSAGKYKRALGAYLELERIEPRDAQWAKRAGETYKRLGNTKNAIEAFERAAERYAQNGFLVQAIAVCKLVLQIDPQHGDTLRRLATMSDQIGAGPTRAAGMAENNPALHEDPNVQVLRRASTEGGGGGTPAPPLRRRGQTAAPSPLTEALPFLVPPRGTQGESAPAARLTPVPERARPKHSTPPVVAMARTKSRPVALPPGMPLDRVDLQREVEHSHRRDASVAGVHVIPIDDEPVDYGQYSSSIEIEIETGAAPAVEVEDPSASYEPEVDESTELDMEDLEEVPMAHPKAFGQAALRALSATPLFAGLPSAALEALVEHLSIVQLEAGDVLFREGDDGDALFVIVEGEVSVQAEGPPRVEMARMGPGAFLGEVALMTDQPRSVTVTAATHAELLCIDRHTLSRVLGQHGDVLRAVLRFVRDRLVDRWIRTSPLFRPFDQHQRELLAQRFAFLEIDPDTKIIPAGVRPDGLYIVLAGQFIVVRGGETVATLGPGDLIGETALLAGGAFRSDVVSTGKSLALCLPARDFREVIMTHPHILEYIGEHAENSRRLQIL